MVSLIEQRISFSSHLRRGLGYFGIVNDYNLCVNIYNKPNSFLVNLTSVLSLLLKTNLQSFTFWHLALSVSRLLC